VKEPLIIQIVEENKIISGMMEQQLEGLGYLVNPIANSGEEALKILGRKMADVVLMDIDFEGKLAGITTAKRILQKMEVQIVFLTKHHDSHYFDLAKEANPLAYLSKPFNIYNLHHTIQMAFKSLVRTQPFSEIAQGCFFVYDKGGYLRIEPNDILFIRPMGSQQEVHFKEKKIIISITAKSLLQKLSVSQVPFLRVHREYVVNLNHISKIDESTLLIDQKLIPIGHTYKKELFNRLTLLSKAKKGA